MSENFASSGPDAERQTLSTYFYRIYGLVLASEIELPEISACQIALSSTPDVHVRFDTFEAPKNSNPFDYVLMADGATTVDIPGVATFAVERGRLIRIVPRPGVHPALVRMFLLSWGMDLIFHQRGLLVLHASAVAFGDHIVAFAGDTAAGKSTMAAYCVQAGAKLVADDMVRVSLTADGVRAYAGAPHLRLWREALDGLDWSSKERAAIFFRKDKFWVPTVGLNMDEQLPLARIYLLEKDEQAVDFICERTTGAVALISLIFNSHGWMKAVDSANRRPAHFQDCVRLANSVEFVRIRRRFDHMQLPHIAAYIAAKEQAPYPAQPRTPSAASASNLPAPTTAL